MSFIVSKFLPQEDWLDLAKKCPIGQARRVYHGAETRPNLIVRNEADRWSAYCHRCHKGGSVRKELVNLAGAQQAKAPKLSLDPGRLVSILDAIEGKSRLEYEVVKRCILHWQEKGVSQDVLAWANPHWSQQDQRIVYMTQQGMLGRDLTGKSPAKWCSYDRQQRFAVGGNYLLQGADIALTEDFYSACKITHYTDCIGVAMLGTSLAVELTSELIQAERVFICTDADKAGDEAIPRILQPLNLLNIRHYIAQPPAGLDPKDLTGDELCQLLSLS